MLIHTDMREYKDLVRVYISLRCTIPNPVKGNIVYTEVLLSNIVPFEKLINLVVDCNIRAGDGVRDGHYNEDISIRAIELLEQYIEFMNSPNPTNAGVNFSDIETLGWVIEEISEITTKYNKRFGKFQIRKWTGNNNTIIYV